MHPTIAKLLENAPVVTDGAWGTQLQSRGLPIGACPDAWNLTHPAEVEDVAKAYVEAGSHIILSNTFGGNRYTLERNGLGDKVYEINRVGAAISRKAAGGRAIVFASVGPSGKMLSMGEIEPEKLKAAFAEQTAALKEGGADGIVIETMSDPEEAALAVGAARETGLPVVACMVYDAGKAGDRTMMGTTPEQAVKILADAGADVIGSNCGKGAAQMLPICERLKAATELPLWLKPNAGLPELVDGKAVYNTSPEEFVTAVVALVNAGASFVGGCCGSAPDYIRLLAKRLSSSG